VMDAAVQFGFGSRPIGGQQAFASQ